MGFLWSDMPSPAQPQQSMQQPMQQPMQHPGLKDYLKNPQNLQGLLMNPMFRMGMGLLSENFQPNGGNPAAGLLAGLGASKEMTEAEKDRLRVEELRRKLAALIAQRQGGPQMSPVPQAQQPKTMAGLLGVG